MSSPTIPAVQTAALFASIGRVPPAPLGARIRRRDRRAGTHRAR